MNNISRINNIVFLELYFEYKNIHVNQNFVTENFFILQSFDIKTSIKEFEENYNFVKRLKKELDEKLTVKEKSLPLAKQGVNEIIAALLNESELNFCVYSSFNKQHTETLRTEMQDLEKSVDSFKACQVYFQPKI